MSEKECKIFYKTLEPCYSPALKELVHFNSGGLHHLLFKNLSPRSFAERQYRLSLLQFVCEVISKASYAELRIKSKSPLVKTWSMSYKITQKDNVLRLVTVIVIRKKPNGKLYFLSVMDK